ncbi:MAG: hypothetical protein NC041_06875 [Bacteroides sp.]|nr:hypothetical protein [Prevotella sp.]MCM1407019.1 hypothetical protein [Treponema brennaborense]MCM1470171.1 hypothetical protein [Bacteroides sp.]
MTKDFTKKSKNLIKKLVNEKGLKLFTMKICFGECTKFDLIAICDFLLANWLKMRRNRYSIFFKWFAGFTRELIIEIDGEVCRPYLYLLLFANNQNLPFLMELKSLAFLSFVKTFKVTEEICRGNVKVPLEEIAAEDYEKVIDDLMLPCIRVIKSNAELEELLKNYQYNKQLCSRGGIISRKNLERDVALDFER